MTKYTVYEAIWIDNNIQNKLFSLHDIWDTNWYAIALIVSLAFWPACTGFSTVIKRNY